MVNYCTLSTWESVELELRHGDSSAGEDKLCSAHQLLPLEDVEGAQILKKPLINLGKNMKNERIIYEK
jgi:hypothetical protein